MSKRAADEGTSPQLPEDSRPSQKARVQLEPEEVVEEKLGQKLMSPGGKSRTLTRNFTAARGRSSMMLCALLVWIIANFTDLCLLLSYSDPSPENHNDPLLQPRPRRRKKKIAQTCPKLRPASQKKARLQVLVKKYPSR